MPSQYAFPARFVKMRSQQKESASTVWTTVEALVGNPPCQELFHMSTYSSKPAFCQPRRRATRRQLVSNALRQTTRLGEGNMFAGWNAGVEIGQALGVATLARNLVDGEDIGFMLADVLADVLGLHPGIGSEEESARRALFCGICREYSQVVRWAYERKVFGFDCEDASAVMRNATQRAATIASNVQRELRQAA